MDHVFAARSNNQLAAIDERTARANLTGENLLNSEEPSAESSNGNFTTDDVQITLTNDKPIEANLSSTSSEIKPFEDDPVNRETANKNTVQNAPSNISLLNYKLVNDNTPIAQVDTFNSEPVGYHAVPETGYDYNAFQSFLNGNLNSNANSINANSNSPNNNVNVNQNSPQTPINKDTSPVQSPPVQSSPPQPLPSSSTEFYGTKTKAKSPANKLKNPEQPVDETPENRQYLPMNRFHADALNPNLLSMNRDRLNYANAANSLASYNFPPVLPSNFYGNLNSLSNLNGFNSLSQMNAISSPVNAIGRSANPAGTFSSPATSLKANLSPTNSGPNPREMFMRKSSNQNRIGTKTAGANSIYGSPPSQSISDASIPQSPFDQQQYGFQSKQQPPVGYNNENSAVQPNANQVAPVTSGSQVTNFQQQITQTNSQRINNRNPNEQTATQQASQSGIFNSILSHIPFIGFNPIRIPIFLSGSASSQPTQQLTANQFGQIVSSQSGEQNIIPTYMIAVNSQSQNAQPINQNQLAEQSVANPTQNKVANNQPSSSSPTGQQQAANSGFVSTMFNRPIAIYNRLTRPLGLSKPALHYSDLPVDSLTEQNLSNLQNYLLSLQDYLQISPPPMMNQNLYETVRQITPQMLVSILQNDKAYRDLMARKS